MKTIIFLWWGLAFTGFAQTITPPKGASVNLTTPGPIGGTTPSTINATIITATNSVHVASDSVVISEGGVAVGNTIFNPDGSVSFASDNVTLDSSGNFNSAFGGILLNQDGSAAFAFSTVYIDGLGNLTATSLKGTNTNDNAPAGAVGEFVTSVVAVGAAVSLSSTVSKTVTSVSLTAGDWDVTGVVDYHPNSLTTGSYFKQGVSTTTNALGSQDQFTAAPMALAAGLGVDPALNAPITRLSLASTTTVYLTCQAGFAVSTLTAYGTIRARRVR